MIEKRKWTLIRNNYGNCLKGMLFDCNGNIICNTLELPFKSNKRQISAIPNGIYDLILHNSARFKRYLIQVDNIPNRELILLHSGNYLRDTNGCILVGDSFVIGQAVINNSIKTLDRVMKLYRSDVPNSIDIQTIDKVNVVGYSKNQKLNLKDIV